MKNLFPLFIDMNGKNVLVVGGGKIAERRIKILLGFGAEITVISPEVTECITSNNIRLLLREYKFGDVSAIKPFLVIAATNNRSVNRNVAEEAKNLGIYVSTADCSDECTFYFPAIAESEEYVAGLVSKKRDHKGVKQTAEKIREVLS